MEFSNYLNFNGQCQEAFKFYEQCFGAKIEMMMTHGEAPMEDKGPAEWRDKIMHVSLRVGNTTLMGSDAPPQRYQKPQGFFVSLAVEAPSDAERIFQALSEGGTVHMPLQKTFWADRFGMVADRFDIPWMVNCGSGKPEGAGD